MLEFLLALLTTATVTALLVPLVKPRLAARDRLASDTAVYRDQLAEVERERGGTLTPAEADAARTEIERRLLAAADKDLPLGARHSSDASSAGHRFLTPALCLAVPLFALGLYLQIGQPGLPSAPFFARSHAPGTPAATPDAGEDLAQTIAAFRARLTRQPDDPVTMSALGEALIRQADGVVTPEAQGLLRRALGKNPDDPRAMFYLGLAEAQAGDSKAALERWRQLAERSPADAPWLPTLRAEMERVARAAGLPVPAPVPGPMAPTPAAPGTAAPGGPTQDQVQAMQNLAPEDRAKAIRGMVDGLEQRLRGSAGKPEDRDAWLRLARARMVLGEADKSADAFAKADALAPLEPRPLADWAEALVRQLKPGQPPAPAAVAVLERLEKAEPRNGLALFYLGAADFAKGDKAGAARRWKALLALLPSDAPIRGMLEAKIKEAE
jgi:cytochrome c-type biogenesis protein CcmH